jgi:hypothetical protein
MNLIELIFVILSIMCAITGARYFSDWGLSAGVAGAFAGLLVPLLFSQLLGWVADFRYSKTTRGRQRVIAEREFDRTSDEKRIKSMRYRPELGNDSSTIVTIYYGKTRPPRRAFYRFPYNSMEATRISDEEASGYIEIRPML